MDTNESPTLLIALTVDQIGMLSRAARAMRYDDPGLDGELAATCDHLADVVKNYHSTDACRFIASEGPNAEFSIIDCLPFGRDADTASVFAVCNSAPGSLNSYGRGHLLVKMLNAANASGALGELV